MHSNVNMSKVISHFLTRDIRRNFIKNLTRCISGYTYEIPEHYQKSFYLANATLHENINWYLHHALELSFNKFVEKVKVEAPSVTHEKAISSVLNRIAILDSCNSVLEINVPLKKNCGRIEIVKGFCAKHGVFEKLHLGGITLSSSLEKSHVEASANLATYKHAIGNIPCAGSHCGIQINPANYTAEELRGLLSNFLSTLMKNNFFGIQRNIFENELVSKYDLALRINEEYLKIKGNTDPDVACITGKSVIHNGLQNYKAAIGDGIIYAMECFLQCDELLNKTGMSKGLCDKTFIIKGLGELATYIADMLTNCGCKCIGIIDGDISVYDKNGINIQEAFEYRTKHVSLANYLRNYEPKKILLEECDILIVTEVYKTLNCYSAQHIKAKLIVEATTGAVTPAAHKIFLAKGYLVLPDLYIKSISSIASFLEYTKCLNITKNLQHRHINSQAWYEQDIIYPYVERQAVSGGHNRTELIENFDHTMINSVIQTIIGDSVMKIIKILENYELGSDIRTATYILALENIFETSKKNYATLNTTT